MSLPSPEPNLTLQGCDLWPEFPFSEAYLAAVYAETSEETIPDSNPDASGKTPVKILEHLRNHPDATLEEVANAIGKRAVEEPPPNSATKTAFAMSAPPKAVTGR